MRQDIQLVRCFANIGSGASARLGVTILVVGILGTPSFLASIPVATAATATIDDTTSQSTWKGYWNSQADARHLVGTERVNGGVGGGTGSPSQPTPAVTVQNAAAVTVQNRPWAPDSAPQSAPNALPGRRKATATPTATATNVPPTATPAVVPPTATPTVAPATTTPTPISAATPTPTSPPPRLHLGREACSKDSRARAPPGR